LTLTDTGPLVGLIDSGDASHQICVAAGAAIRLPMVTTLPVLTEVLYLLQSRAGWKSESLIFTLIRDGRLQIAELSTDMLYRTEDLMAKYANLPMDFADASLVAVAEDLGMKQIFTLDEHFQVYRLRGREPFEVIPGPG